MGDTLALGWVHVGDIRDLAPRIAPGSVNCIVTSPPYWRLRSYIDGDDPRKARELGSESTVEEFVANLVGVLRLLRPALHPTATCWINLGDSYANDGKWGGATGGKHAAGLHGADGPGRGRTASGLPPKCLTLAPARFAIAMVEDGWILRNDIIWHKPNPMPESVTDRCTTSHEHVFLFAKRPTYWADMEAIREPQSESTLLRFREGQAPRTRGQKFRPTDEVREYDTGAGILPNGRSARDVWAIPTAGFPGAHYATFPPELARRCIRAGCPPRVCARCGAPWARETASGNPSKWANAGGVDRSGGAARTGNPQTSAGLHRNGGMLVNTRQTLGWRAACACDAGTRPGVVMDPFLGSGTTALVAVQENRDWLGVDLDGRSVSWVAGRLAGAQRRLPLDGSDAAAGG